MVSNKAIQSEIEMMSYMNVKVTFSSRFLFLTTPSHNCKCKFLKVAPNYQVKPSSTHYPRALDLPHSGALKVYWPFRPFTTHLSLLFFSARSKKQANEWFLATKLLCFQLTFYGPEEQTEELMARVKDHPDDPGKASVTMGYVVLRYGFLQVLCVDMDCLGLS